MAEAEATSPAIAKRSSFGIRLPLPAAITGHARLLARPAYQRLVAAEPLLRRLIPILIAIFLVIVGLTRVVELYGLKVEREVEARGTVSLIATLVAIDKLARPERRQAAGDAANALAKALAAGARPPTAAASTSPIPPGQDPRRHARPQARWRIPLTSIIRRDAAADHLRRARRRSEITLADGTPALATVRLLQAPYGMVAVVQPTAAVYSDWRADVSLNATIFIGTSAILLVILYGYFAQSTRASEADRIYAATQARFETALGPRPLRPVGLGPGPRACSGRARCSRSSGSSRATRSSASARSAASSTTRTAT